MIVEKCSAVTGWPNGVFACAQYEFTGYGINLSQSQHSISLWSSKPVWIYRLWD